jgi:hypothetical protein
MNARYSFTTLYQGFEKKGQAGMIQKNVTYQTVKAIERSVARSVSQTYGFSTGTKAVVKTTGSAGATQTGIALKNGYGSSLIPGTATADQTYISSIFRVGDPVCAHPLGAMVEFGVVVASPAVGSGVGFIDITFARPSPRPPTTSSGPAAVTATLSETDQNRWPVGLLDACTLRQPARPVRHGQPVERGLGDTTGGRMSFSRIEKMANASGITAASSWTRMIWSQGVRRDTISGERGVMVYDSSQVQSGRRRRLQGREGLHLVLARPGRCSAGTPTAHEEVAVDLADYERWPVDVRAGQGAGQGRVQRFLQLHLFASVHLARRHGDPVRLAGAVRKKISSTQAALALLRGPFVLGPFVQRVHDHDCHAFKGSLPGTRGPRLDGARVLWSGNAGIVYGLNNVYAACGAATATVTSKVKTVNSTQFTVGGSDLHQGGHR